MRGAVRLLAGAPASLPQLGALVIMVVWAGSEGGYPVTTWTPGALLILGLLAASVAALPVRWRAVPRPVVIAGGLLLAFTLWSYLSISWAGAKGDAWDGANRTLLFFLVFALFATWPQRAGTSTALLGAWTAGMGIVALVTLLRISSTAHPLTFFIGDRLAEPAGYPNAAAATWLMAVWPAVVLAGRAETPWWARGAFAGITVLLADLALLSQSRGALFSLPIVLIVFFIVVPGRVRSLSALLPIAVGLAVTVPGVLDVQERIRDGEALTRALDDVVPPVLLAALVVALVVTAAALVEHRARIAPDVARRAHRAVGAAGLAGVAVVAIVALAIAGNPVARARDGWHSFKRGYPNTSHRSRLTAGLGSNRYDFYRVAVKVFRHHPLVGAGADNYAQDYLVWGHSDETPRYPHSLELRTLSQTGILGTLLLAGVFAAALVAAFRALRRREPLAAATAGGATLVFVYWAVHGSFDWFWEYAGLGAPAFAMLGLACALAPRLPAADAPARSPRRRRALAGGAIAAGVLAVLSLGGPWLAEREIRIAARDWPGDPALAFRRLDRAASLNPLSDRPELTEGTIALRLGDLGHAKRAFSRALDRNSRASYALLELGAIASDQRQPAAAERLLARARALNPRDPYTKQALEAVRAGRRVDIASLNLRIARQARELTR